ncbi:MAG TPA: CHAP domain-containing protein, partial [Acidimicrobiales bacterium]|nr:CHAP domain-containing protein [Acidimicrobiales bacterium]
LNGAAADADSYPEGMLNLSFMRTTWEAVNEMPGGGLIEATRPAAGRAAALVLVSLALVVAAAATSSAASAQVRAATGRAPGTTRPASQAALDGAQVLGTPDWWQGGVCDPTNAPGSRPLGASWDGLVACGPGPTQGGTDHLVSFFPGAWGEFEWECVELSMRWMYLAWGVNPYPADGWDVVRDYDLGTNRATYNPEGPDLVAVKNGTTGAVPQPGDVVSVGRDQDDSFGHTAVVTANAVDAQGNGAITLIQQNGGAGNDGWVTYPVADWVVGNRVTGWLHNPSWTLQLPVVGFIRTGGFEARVAAPGNSYGLVATGATSIAVAGDAGTNAAPGATLYGYMSRNRDFFVKRASSTTWSLAARRARSIALATTASGAPVLAFLDTTGDFYAEVGSLTGHFTLEARGVASIGIADGGDASAPLLGYVQSKSGAFLVKMGITGDTWTIAHRSGVRAIALAEGATASSEVLGYVTTSGSFFAEEGSLDGPWAKEANGVSAISLAAVGPTGTPLLGYLAGDVFFAAESAAPVAWTEEASGVTAIAVTSSAAPGALPILGYVTAGGNLDLMRGQLSGRFSLQARGTSSVAISSLAVA